ncbi:MAG: Gfo/Idh/MocA family oxidoreductase [Pyrinomonadaceae bacterium]|nr:Gfo/Idh/MocA family oxidoreductase [Pyrinomonadaceae bacterium]
MNEIKRVLVVGARRKRQGTGPFVARAFKQAGAEICGIVGTSENSIDEALDILSSEHDVNCPGYESLGKALEEQNPDILAICSPYEFHLEALNTAASQGIHCLCEKPLWWDEAADRKFEVTAKLIKAFQENGRLLETITQWPHTLETFYTIYPEEKEKPVTQFEFDLSPAKQSADMLQNSAPHLLSMLYALAGVGKIKRPEISILGGQIDHWQLTFLYEAAQTEIKTSFNLIPAPKPPRPAGYAINGKRVERKIHLPEYSFSFEFDDTLYPLADPLDMLVGSFLKKVYIKRSLDSEGLLSGMKGLITLDESLKTRIRSLLEAIGN